MTERRAIQEAQAEANEKGWAYTVWVLSDCYSTTSYLESDKLSGMFFCKVEPEVQDE